MVDWEESQKIFSPPFFEAQKIFLPFQRAQKIFHSKIHSPTNLIGVKILTKFFPLKIFSPATQNPPPATNFRPPQNCLRAPAQLPPFGPKNGTF